MIKWSYSGLKNFINCPRQYHEVKVLQNFRTPTTDEMRYGTEVHQALENYVRNGIPLSKNYMRFKPMLDVLMAVPGNKYVEHQMALTQDRKPCGFKDANYWVRGIADLLIVDGDTAFIVDYKTGKAKYPDPAQLKLMALMTFAHFPEVQTVKAALAFILYDVFVDEVYSREDIETLWGKFLPDLQRLNIAHDTDKWMPNPTPLCGWCPVNTCEYHSRKRN